MVLEFPSRLPSDQPVISPFTKARSGENIPASRRIAMSAEVFVSYARVDRARVLQLVERMRSAGVGVWIDEGGIHGASLWGQEIVDAIESARVMVLMLSDAPSPPTTW